MRKILTISELTRDIKEVLENVFESCCVEGEVSNFRQPASGHLYFILKDATATIRCVMFRSSAERLKFRPQDGMLLIACGRIGVYEKEGQYQLYVDALEPKGQGALQLAFEQLKARLSKEGLFEASHKKALPFLPKAIGVVTSPTGAVIRDILHVLDRRFPAAHVIIHPVRVQGEGSAGEIAEALRVFNELANVDVVILARGGGSIEDLWSFNEEGVARAIYASKIPVISAVGHETDYTIADFVADRRAPTPSAAAEIVSPSRAELDDRIENLLQHLVRGVRDVVPQYSQRIDDLCENLSRGLTQYVTTRRMRLEGLRDELGALNPLAILARGYSLTTLAATGRIITSVDDVSCGDKLTSRLANGTLTSEVTQTHGL